MTNVPVFKKFEKYVFSIIIIFILTISNSLLLSLDWSMIDSLVLSNEPINECFGVDQCPPESTHKLWACMTANHFVESVTLGFLIECENNQVQSETNVQERTSGPDCWMGGPRS